MKTAKKVKIETIIRQYKAMKKRSPDRHFDHCIAQANLFDAISVAAKAVNSKNKIHNHQRRIGRMKLNIFAQKVMAKEQEMKKVKSFDELLKIIDDIKCERIGELTKYDTATRIGAYLNIFPNKVYLHSGTRLGAKKLLGHFVNKKYLTLDELPSRLTNGQTASELEDILCIFKENF